MNFYQHQRRNDRELQSIATDVAIASGPQPRRFVIPDRSPNARAAGRAQRGARPSRSSVGADSTWSKVTNLDAATYASDCEAGGEEAQTGAVLWSTAPRIVLRALLRLLLRV